MTGVLIWAGVCTALTAVCLTRPQLGRSLIGLFFLAMALGINLNLVVNDPQRFVTYAEGAYLPFYRDIALRVVGPASALFGLAVAAYEIVVALLVLQRGRAVRIGLGGVILFLLWIIPIGKEEAPNFILIIGVASLLTRRFTRSSLATVRLAFRHRTLTGRSAGTHPALPPLAALTTARARCGVMFPVATTVGLIALFERGNQSLQGSSPSHRFTKVEAQTEY